MGGGGGRGVCRGRSCGVVLRCYRPGSLRLTGLTGLSEAALQTGVTALQLPDSPARAPKEELELSSPLTLKHPPTYCCRTWTRSCTTWSGTAPRQTTRSGRSSRRAAVTSRPRTPARGRAVASSAAAASRPRWRRSGRRRRHGGTRRRCGVWRAGAGGGGGCAQGCWVGVADKWAGWRGGRKAYPCWDVGRNVGRVPQPYNHQLSSTDQPTANQPYRRWCTSRTRCCRSSCRCTTARASGSTP